MKDLKIIMNIVSLVLFSGSISCEKHARSFSILDDTTAYQQTGETISRKIDILWVIDNSGSMASSQSNLAQNFKSFFKRFDKLNLDFHMAFTTTDAYLANFNKNPLLSEIRDGSKDSGHSGVFILDNTTQNLENIFMTNITQGISGYGDERAFDSLEQTLANQKNSAFLRKDAFLSVIIVSDEDDFSATTKKYLKENYKAPEIIPTSHYVKYLDDLTGNAPQRNFSVNAISIYDEDCLETLSKEFVGRRIGKRYAEIADATGGIKGSLCSNFGDTLEIISNSIIELSSIYNLTRVPIVETISIYLDGIKLNNNSENGWTYDSTENSIHFHGDGIPRQGALVAINFDPLTIKSN